MDSSQNLKNIRRSALFFVLFLFLCFVFIPNSVLAQINVFSEAAGISSARTLPEIIGRIVQVALAFLGILAIILIMFAGFKYMTSDGDPTKVEKAKKMIIQAVIGLVIIFASFAIVTFIFSNLTNIVEPDDNSLCTVGDVQYSGVDNCAYRYCISENSWGQWNNDGCYYYTANQYSYVTGFKDESLLINGVIWQIGVTKSFTGVKSIPLSANLQVRGYGHYKGTSNEITAMNLRWIDIASGSSAFSPIENVIKNINGNEFNVVENIYAPWNTSQYTTGTTSTIDIFLTPQDSSYFFKKLKVKFIPDHCFDGIKNFGETGIDCGSVCGGACPGESCDNEPSTSSCQANDNMCRYGVCNLDTCSCIDVPQIDYISPVLDVLGDTKLNRPNTWSDDIPNGANGNLITIWGSGFGNSTGTVTFVDNAGNSYNAEFPGAPCSNLWSENQIIIKVPNTPNVIPVTSTSQMRFNTSTNYSVKVNSVYGIESNGKPFQVNQIERPGICSATAGSYPATTTIYGLKFPTGATKNVLWSIGSYVNGTWINGRLTDAVWAQTDVTSTRSYDWTNNSVIDYIPEANSTNTAKVRIFNGAEYSNYYSFILSRGGVGESCGYYDNACSVNNGLCQSGLTCDYSTCLCEPILGTCVPNQASTTSCTVANPIANCSYKFRCNSAGTSWDCAPDLTDADCSINPYTTFSKQIFYAWAFNSLGWGNIDQSCGIDPWGACDPRGCNRGLSCNLESCTCVQAQTCKKGEVNPCTIEGAPNPNGTCKWQEVCGNDGIFGQCQLVDPFCYNPVPQAQQTMYSWLFNFNAGSLEGNPYIIESCLSNCNVRIPTPSPWYKLHITNEVEGWATNKGIAAAYAPACSNALITAEFNRRMNANTINSSTVKIYRVSTTGEKIPLDIQINLENDKFLQLSVAEGLTTSTVYQVNLSDQIYSYEYKKLVFTPNSQFAKDKRGCDANAAYCWNFTTRNTLQHCEEGCIGCAPNPTKMYWQGATTSNFSYLTSQDNYCLTLNTWDYNWQWDVLPGPSNQLGDLRYNNYIAITNKDFCDSTATTTERSDLCRFQLAVTDNKVDPFQVSAALGDNRLGPNATITAAIPGKPLRGECKVINNFTDVMVVEDRDCTDTTQSPSPFKGATDACTNALISARFNRPIVDETLTLSTSTRNGNIIIEDCGSTEPTPTSTCTLVNLNEEGITPTIRIFEYSRPLAYENLFTSSTSATTSLPEGFIIDVALNQKIKYNEKNAKTIIESGYLDPNKWYRVIIKGGENGLRGSKAGSDNLKEGHLITPSFGNNGWVYNGGTNANPPSESTDSDAYKDYYWKFKTATSTCEVSSINVQPKNIFLSFIAQFQQYDAVPQAGNCNVLARCFINWDWWSLVNYTDEHSYRPPHSELTETGASIATISKNPSTLNVCGIVDSNGTDNFNLVDPVQTAESVSEGSVFITAMAHANREGWAKLRVGSDSFRVVKHGPEDTMCTNPDLEITFSRDASLNNIYNYVKLYECTGDSNCNNISNDHLIDFAWYRPNVNYSNKITFGTNNLDGRYRVMVNGISSFDNLSLSGLNYRLNGETVGEACEQGIYPWINNDQAYCSSTNCLFDSTMDLCGKEFKQCTTTESNLMAYCSTNCKNLGNTNIASCGNGIIEPGEDCDDNNITSGDGCSSNCLLVEGSKAVCGNGKIEKGEQCDDGNSANGDGCSSICLYESNYATSTNSNSLYKDFNCASSTGATSTIVVDIAGNAVKVKVACMAGEPGCNNNCLNQGSNPNAPVCGNGKIEFGEDCDYGVNNGNGICSDQCLWVGSSEDTGCGNGTLDRGEADAYSWTFTVDPTAQRCGPVVALNPCQTGIWRVSVPKNIEDLRIVIDKKYETADDFGENECQIIAQGPPDNASIFVKIWYKIKAFVKKFIGSATASNYLCLIYDRQFTSELIQMDKGNYTATSTLANNNGMISLVAYGNDSGERIINFINDQNWSDGETYRMRLFVNGNFSIQSTTTIFRQEDQRCQINNVKSEIWPLGWERNKDNFFCNGDYCGSLTPEQKADDDQSASWNNDFDFSNQNNLPRNQHLYRFWAYGSTGFRVKADFKEFRFTYFGFANEGGTLVKLDDTEFYPTSTYSTTTYNGARWINSGNIQGMDLYHALAFNPANPDAGTMATGTVTINTFNCDNPWPDPSNFPFIDGQDNCISNDGSACPNTNFSTFYCRDNGKVSACWNGSSYLNDCKTNSDCQIGVCRLHTEDDLPSIGDYDVTTEELNVAISGMRKEQCNNLPNEFYPTVGYFEIINTIQSVHLWSEKEYYRSTSSGNTNLGWEKVSRGELALFGLPGNFNPIAGYNLEGKTYLWSNDGNFYYKIDSDQVWRKGNRNDLVAPGYPLSKKPLFAIRRSDDVIIWNSDRSAYIFNGSYTATTTIVLPNGFAPVTGNFCSNCLNNNIHLWDKEGNGYECPNNLAITSNCIKIDKTARGLSGVNPTMGYYANLIDSTVTILWDGGNTHYVYNSVTARFEKSTTNESDCQTKLKEFLFVKNYSNLINSSHPVVSKNGNLATFTPVANTCTSIGTDFIYQCRATTNGNPLAEPIIFNITVTSTDIYNLSLLTSNNNASASVASTPPTTQYCDIGNTNPICYGDHSCYRDDGTGEEKVFQDIIIFIDNQTVPVDYISAWASAPDNKQLNYSRPFYLSQGDHTITLKWVNDCNYSANGQSPYVWDSNLKIYNLSLYRQKEYDEDAIGIRIMSNDNHYPALTWYRNTFNVSGNPTAKSVDSYRAITDGRTVYVNAANTSTDDSIYTNIYLMSRTQGNSSEMQNIFNQMVNNWTFNYNFIDQVNFSQCYGTGYNCFSDKDCPTNSYCLSPKAKLTRDVKRVEDIHQMQEKLLAYYDIKKCSNDQSRRCLDDTNCYGGGRCSNFFPDIKAGSYITGKTYSVWPSWQETLGKSLGSVMAIDPINKLYGCSGDYDSTTCWSNENKQMLSPDIDSSVYIYFAYTTNGANARFYAKSEYDLTGGNKWRPYWQRVNGLRYNPFYSGWENVIEQMASSVLPTCGNGTFNTGENCSNCPYDVPCAGVCNGGTCLENCGDGTKQAAEGEECDKGPNGGYDGARYCAWNCKYVASCGDSNIDPGEQCDGINLGGNTCETVVPGTCDYSGATLSCDSNCRFNVSQCKVPIWNTTAWSPATCGPTTLFQIRTTTAAFSYSNPTCLSNSRTKPIEKRSCNCDVDYAAVCSGKCGIMIDKCAGQIDCGNNCLTGGVCELHNLCTPLGELPCQGSYQTISSDNTRCICVPGTYFNGSACVCESWASCLATEPEPTCTDPLGLISNKCCQEGYYRNTSGVCVFDTSVCTDVSWAETLNSAPNPCPCSGTYISKTYKCIMNGVEVDSSICANCNISAIPDVIASCNHFNDGYCDSSCTGSQAENFNNDNSCPLKNGDLFTLKTNDGGQWLHIGINYINNIYTDGPFNNKGSFKFIRNDALNNEIEYSIPLIFFGIAADGTEKHLRTYSNYDYLYTDKPAINASNQIYLFTLNGGNGMLMRGSVFTIREFGSRTIKAKLKDNRPYFESGNPLELTLCNYSGNCDSLIVSADFEPKVAGVFEKQESSIFEKILKFLLNPFYNILKIIK